MSHRNLFSLAAVIWLAAVTACSFQPRVPDGTVVCGSAGQCPAGTHCVSPDKGQSGPSLCCRDSSCAGPSSGAGGTGGTRPPGARGSGGAPASSDAAGLDLAPASDAEPGGQPDLGHEDVSAPPADGAAADAPPTSEIPDMRPVEPPPQDDATLAPGLMAYLRLDETPTNQSWHDSSGNGNAAILHGTDAQAMRSEGRYRQGLRLAGGTGGGWLEMSASTSFNDIIHGVSVSAWILFAADDTGDGTILARRSASGSGQLYLLEVVGDKLHARLNTAGGYNANLTGGTVAHGRWVHVAMTYDEHNVRLFVDGLERASMPYALGLPPELTPVMVGAAEPGVGGAPIARLAATIDEVAVYNRALSGRELTALAGHARPTAK